MGEKTVLVRTVRGLTVLLAYLEEDPGRRNAEEKPFGQGRGIRSKRSKGVGKDGGQPACIRPKSRNLGADLSGSITADVRARLGMSNCRVKLARPGVRPGVKMGN